MTATLGGVLGDANGNGVCGDGPGLALAGGDVVTLEELILSHGPADQHPREPVGAFGRSSRTARVGGPLGSLQRRERVDHRDIAGS